MRRSAPRQRWARVETLQPGPSGIGAPRSVKGQQDLFIASGDAYSADAYEQAITNRGGAFYYADDPSAIDAIIDSITSEQAQTLEATHEVVIIERPEAVLWIAVVGVAGIIFIRWRLGS